jgi:di/tricarboxylate transporter
VDPNSIAIFLILIGAVVLFATEKFPVDFVAIGVLGALLVSGIVAPEKAISGFSNSATVTVGAMFVLSAGLTKTGALQVVARWMVKLGKYPVLLLVPLMVTAAAASAFINNTPVVAVFLPLVLAMCAKRNLSPSKFLIPLSFAAQFGGVCTLIGTSTNLLVSEISAQAGYGAFSMFEFSKLGLIMVAAGILYFLVAGYWMLPRRGGGQLTETYQLGEYITELRVMPKSPLVGATLSQHALGKRHDVTVLEILRGDRKIWAPRSEVIQEGDVLLVRGQMSELMDLRRQLHLELEQQFKLQDDTLRAENLALMETVVPPQSALIGKTLSELEFHRRYNAIVLAVQRRGQTLRDSLSRVRLQAGDALLIQAPREEAAKLRGNPDFVLLEQVEEPSFRKSKGPLALLIIGLVVLFASAPIIGDKPFPILATAVVGCIAMVMTRCISLEEAYRAIDWKVIFLLAGVLPLGIAMMETGTAAWLAKQGVMLVGDFGPVAVLAMMYLLTAALTECMSNNAAAVLMAPIAISTANSLGVSPTPFLMAIMFAASTAFATPVGYQTNTMVYNPGGYRFMDFMKVGVPLNLIFWALAVYFIPKFWSF